MGEEKKEKEKKEEGKEEEKKEDEYPEIVLKVDMHCLACSRKVARALKGFQDGCPQQEKGKMTFCGAGVEAVIVDSKNNKVVVKGKAADPLKVCERLQKKSGRKVEIISPLPKPPEKKEEIKELKEEKKEEPPAVKTVVLKVQMHCEACAQVLQRRIRKIQGVESVDTDLGSSQVTVRGAVDPATLVDYVRKRTRKQATIVKQEEKKDEGEKKKEEGEKVEDKKEEKLREGEIKKLEYLGPKYNNMEYYYPQIFSDENSNACSVM